MLSNSRITMVRPNSGSRIRSQPTTSRSTASDWPTPLLNASASPGSRSEHLSSYDGEHSPNDGHSNEPMGSVHTEDQWHEAFQQSVNETQSSQENRNVAHLLPFEFNALGQPIGDSKAYSTKVGVNAKSIVSPSYETWRKVPPELKEEVWRAIKNVYNVPEFFKDKAIKMANKSWRNGKTPLRKVCDDVGATVSGKKSKRPRNQKKEDWEAFVDMVNKDSDKVVRVRGRTARKAVKALHSTGRDGIAQCRHIMEQQSPTGTVSRSVVFVATHVYQELPEEDLEQFDPNDYEEEVKELLQTEQYTKETHVDRDAVAKVFGRDRGGFVRGTGDGVSKTELLAYVIPKEQLRQEQLKNRVVEDRLRVLEEYVEAARGGDTSNVNTGQSMDVDTGSEHRVHKVVLRNLRKRSVAFGRVDPSAQPTNGDCLVSLIKFWYLLRNFMMVLELLVTFL
ncbi:hypothetical protein C5167_008775 [Papaver somniferum]|uniref:Uncharacterized protein n=1 Tax=Papaver somniferum TaxID=3469 RepID=A0A4Y7JZE1_PAPSO|nr:hypothetical protein C5167_008775 [Papaver somniferum]